MSMLPWGNIGSGTTRRRRLRLPRKAPTTSNHSQWCFGHSWLPQRNAPFQLDKVLNGLSGPPSADKRQSAEKSDVPTAGGQTSEIRRRLEACARLILRRSGWRRFDLNCRPPRTLSTRPPTTQAGKSRSASFRGLPPAEPLLVRPQKLEDDLAVAIKTGRSRLSKRGGGVRRASDSVCAPALQMCPRGWGMRGLLCVSWSCIYRTVHWGGGFVGHEHAAKHGIFLGVQCRL